MLALGLAAVGFFALAWLFYFRWKDARRPEPLWLLLATAGGGAASVPVAHLGFDAADAFGSPSDWELLSTLPVGPALVMAGQIGLIEEGAKLLPVILIARFSHHFDEPLDGLVYAACAGVGFSVSESAALLASGELAWIDAVGRALAAPATHGLFAAPAGLGVSGLFLRRRPVLLAAGFAVSALAHGLFDLLLARPPLPPAVAAGVVLVLWAWLIWMTPRLARLRRAELHSSPSPGLR